MIRSAMHVSLWIVILGLTAGANLAWSDETSDSEVQQIRELIGTYAKSIESADVDLAAQIWETSKEVSFI